MEKHLSYDQISLIPTKVSTLEHRAEADTSVQFGGELKLPIIAAPMPDVSNSVMAWKLAGLGSLGWIHRFQSIQDATAQANMTPSPANAIRMGIAGGLTDYMERAAIRQHGAFCLDTANGASEMVKRAIGTLKDKYPDIFIVAGNVASPEAFYALESWGADGIRVGIAGGSVCETRTETGVYSPMASVIRECAYPLQSIETWKPRKALLIADGGIRTPGDMCKALALGADVVMLGGALAGTDEAPGNILKDRDGKKYKILRGAASFSVQKEAGSQNIDYNEGAEAFIPYTGSVEKVIKRFSAGLRSSMSYMNARNLTEFRNNVKIVEVS